MLLPLPPIVPHSTPLVLNMDAWLWMLFLEHFLIFSLYSDIL